MALKKQSWDDLANQQKSRFFTRANCKISTRTFMYRNQVYASPTAALEAYLASQLVGDKGLLQDDVEDLLLSGASLTLYDSPQSPWKEPPILQEAESLRNLSIQEMVDHAYKQLKTIQANQQSAGRALSASEAVLNQVTMDNLSSLPGSPKSSRSSSASKQSWLHNAPGGVKYPATSTPHVANKEAKRNQTLAALDLSLERLKNSLNDQDKDDILAAQLTPKTLGILSKLKHSRHAGDLHEAHRYTRSDSRIMQSQGKDRPRTKYKHSNVDLDIHSQGNKRSQNSTDKLQHFGAHSSKMSYFKNQQGRDMSQATPRRPPSWVEDLANTEISSVAGNRTLEESVVEGPDMYDGPALSMNDLSASVKAPSRVWRAKNDPDGYTERFDFLPQGHQERIRQHISDINNTVARDATHVYDTDKMSLTTDDLCFASPDARNLKSILRTPNSPAKKPSSWLSSSTDDMLAESLKAPGYFSQNMKGVSSHSRQAVRFHVEGGTYLQYSPQSSCNVAEYPNPELLNNRHRDYIKQLVNEIEESCSVVTSLTGGSQYHDASESLGHWPAVSQKNSNLDGSFIPQRPGYKLVSETDHVPGSSTNGQVIDKEYDLLEQMQRLLLTPPPKQAQDDEVYSPSTEEVLDGERSWEKLLPNFKPLTYGTESLSKKETLNIVDKFLEECKEPEKFSETITKKLHPGSMEALKNILFTVQTMVPPSELSDHLEDSSSSPAVNGKGEKGKQNAVSPSLQHLLASDSESDTATGRPASLNAALQHLNTLKTLMNAKPTPQMTSTPNR